MDRDLGTLDHARERRAKLVQEARTYAIVYNARHRRIGKLGYAYLGSVAAMILYLLVLGVRACTR